MDKLIQNIVETIRTSGNINEEKLATLIRSSNKRKLDNSEHNAKKYLMPYYQDVKANHQELWASWGITEDIENKLLDILKVKPKRSASGVATITVITKPWKCGGNCLFCPNDIRMPKSYLSDEPACQRAERNYFDPFLQVSARLRALSEMGHSTDKVEIIILGGTFHDYEQDYQRWFVSEVFRALNCGVLQDNHPQICKIEQMYENAGWSNNTNKLKSDAKEMQKQINNFELNYNDAFEQYYSGEKYTSIFARQKASWDDVYAQHEINENCKHRCVGLVIETRPAAISEESLTLSRKLGCTKIQMGIQSLNLENLEASERVYKEDTISNAFELMRKFGFKIHVHFMANLPLSSPEQDKIDYKNLVQSKPYQPDEIKLYPCMLVESARLNKWADAGKWKAYDEQTLIDVLADDIINTPCFTRISRMMRDISSNDITQGVKKTNLRQMVEIQADKVAKEKGIQINEIRHREIALSKTKDTEFTMEDFVYVTSNTTEHFLQYITPQNKILGFLRLSLPNQGDCAMIREVHVYGIVANVGEKATNAQHKGLGTNLIEKACQIAKENYKKINVISAIGTRQYYNKRGFDNFSEDGLYQQRKL